MKIQRLPSGWFLSRDSVLWMPLWWLLLKPLRAIRFLRGE